MTDAQMNVACPPHAHHQVSWTCNEHAEAWRRSGPISVKDQAPCDVASPTSIPRGHPHAAKPSDICASTSIAPPVDVVGAEEVSDSGASKGTKINGLGMFAKLKGRLGRLPAAANASTVNQGKAENR